MALGILNGDRQDSISNDPRRRGGRVLFEIPLHRSIDAAAAELLRRQLGMTTHAEQKLRPEPNGAAVARLDPWSGLFLEPAPGRDRWLLQARTWGRPSLPTVHGWHLRVALVARQLDPRVMVPPRAPTDQRVFQITAR